MHRLSSSVLVLFASAASANSFGSLDEVPITTGELRFVQPRSGERGIGFPLEKTTLTGSIDGAVAGLRLEQRFSNPSNEPVEAVYVFPLGERAAVHDYEFVIGDRVIRGKIDTKDRARATYEAAKRSGHTASLLEQERPNVFLQRVANIPPRQSVTVRLTLAELLEPEGGQFEFVFPMVVGPRYQPLGSPGITDSPRVKAVRSTVDIDLLVDTAVPTTSLTSPSHPIQRTSIDRFKSRVSLVGAAPDADFVLRFGGAAEKTGAGLLTHRTDGDGYFLLLLQPKTTFRAAEVSRRDVVFIIDTSCSMSGAPLSQAVEVATAILDTLRPADTFSMITFASGTSRLDAAPLRANTQNLERGRQWLRSLSAAGGTELVAGLTSGYEQPPEDGVRAIYVLTDGFVSNDDEIVSLVRRTGAFNRLYPVGIGSSPNRALLGALGEVGRGFTRYVASHDEAAQVAEELVARSTQPYLTDVQIDWRGLDVSQLEPPVVPDLHVGQPIVVAGRYRRPGRETITISGKVNGKPVSLPMDVTLEAVAERPALSTLWARRRIARLELDDERGAQQGAITDLGLGHHLLTKYTSFVAVDGDGPAVSGVGSTVEQPLPLPRGMAPPPARSPTWALPSRGGGGDLDPFTIATIASFGPLAWALRKRRLARREPPR